MYSPPDDAALPAPGFPIRRSAGQRLFSASPRLIAAVHVLLRLLVPRHPPCALPILTVSSPHAGIRAGRFITHIGLVQFSRSTEARAAECFRRRSLKTEQHGRELESSRSWIPDARMRLGARSTLGTNLPRKEVIQPQLPLRLPCYDFTPVTGPTFDGCLPKGLAHRLRVLPTPVV